MKHSTYFWQSLIEDRKFNQFEAIKFFTYAIPKINEEYSLIEDNGLQKDSVIFMDNICHVITSKYYETITTQKANTLLNNLGEIEIRLFINLIVNHSIIYKSSGFDLNFYQLGLIKKFLAFNKYVSLVSYDKKTIIKYLQGKIKKRPI